MNKLIIILSFGLVILTACHSATRMTSTTPQNSLEQVTETIPTVIISEDSKIYNGKLEPPFVRSDIIPGQTKAGEVKQILGDPVSRSSFNDFGTWTYNVQNYTQAMSILFEKDVVSEIWIPITDFRLGDLVDQLGAPEIIELTINQPDLGPLVYPQKVFHYPSLGTSYYVSCIVNNVNLGEDCQQHYRADEIERMSQYVPLSQPE